MVGSVVGCWHVRGGLAGPPLQRMTSRTEYFRENVYIAPSGLFGQAQLRFCLETVPLERIVFAVDYPFASNDGAVAFLDEADLPEQSKRMIAHENAELLLRL
ncbi:amidohydrolase family protein [Streptomyces sp. NPDC056337]|uniref:amidohydrolase family protein n=1 Tax=Streptomyces sp. NPDC056337 TaxID=3345787 RepID=UPI0035D57260